MNNIVFYNAGISDATQYAAKVLQGYGYTFCTDNLNAATHLLLDTPNRENIIPEIDNENITVIGGNLSLPYPTIDLLKDPVYIAQNAMITAHCAIKVALTQSRFILPDQSALVIGWGRIGKCLAQLLRQMGCYVTVAARKHNDRAILAALGYTAITTDAMPLDNFGIIFNTVPELLVENCTSSATIIELASTPGITGNNIISARGLPGKEAPASSGQLIAQTIHRILNGKEFNI